MKTQTNKFYCDICMREIKEPNMTKSSLFDRYMFGMAKFVILTDGNIHYCKSCITSYEQWIKSRR